jgi:hypothetical protein
MASSGIFLQQRAKELQMRDDQNVNNRQPVAKYRQVEISNLKRGRHGKHFELVQGIVKEC